MQDISLLLQCILLGILGQIFHLLIDYKTQLKSAKTANEKIPFFLYLKESILSIISSIIAIVICALVIDELIAYQIYIGNFVKLFFVAIGFMGSDILQEFLGNARKKVLDVIDKKTNIADSILEKGEINQKDISGLQDAQKALDADIGDRPTHPKGPK